MAVTDIPEEAIRYPSGKRRKKLHCFFEDARSIFKIDELGLEIAQIAFPAALALTADPIASLVDTAFIGQIGPVELAAVGVSIAVFNQVSRIAIFPLVSVTTSFVAEEDAASGMSIKEKQSEESRKAIPRNEEMEVLIPRVVCESGVNKSSLITEIELNITKFEPVRRHIPSGSSALVIGLVLGILQAVILIFGAKPILNFMGVNSIRHKADLASQANAVQFLDRIRSPNLLLGLSAGQCGFPIPAQQYLKLRSLGAPAVLLSLAAQGVFRGFKDTKTPLYATVAGDATNIILDPIFIFAFRLGVSGAAVAHVISQYLILFILLWRLRVQVDVLPPSIKDLQFNRFLKNGFLLLARVIAVTFCVTLAASMATRQGSISMAAFQICLQVWLASSLLADGLAVAGQAILASSFARGDYVKARTTASRVLQLGLLLGLFLSVVLGIGMQFASRLFTKDVNVLRLMHIGIPFVAVTQPINALAFVFDGINFGASDFAYSAYSMVLVAVASILCLFVLSSSHGFVGIWVALTIYMSLRVLAGFWRIGTARGPWTFLRS